MKKLLYLLPAAAMILTGCANEDPFTGPQTPTVVPVAENYITINVIPSNGLGSRAGDYFGDATNDQTPEGEYIDGTDMENKVSAVRFFFFAADGSPSAVWARTSTTPDPTDDEAKPVATEFNSYLDWYPGQGDEGPGNNATTVEAILTTTLGIVTPGEGNLPVAVVAILNPTADIKNLGSAGTKPSGASYTLYGPSLDDLRAEVGDYYTNLHGIKDNQGGNFLMSNSVYVYTPSAGTDGEPSAPATSIVMDYTPIAQTNFQSTPELAADNAVEIYVERVLSRVDFSLGFTAAKNPSIGLSDDVVIYKVGSQAIDGEAPTEGQETTDIYIKLLGWNVSSVIDESRLLKSVDASWTNSLVFKNTTNWNWPQSFRSFWAINPEDVTDANYQYGNFGFGTTEELVTGNVYPANGLPIPATGKYTTTYVQENASPYYAAGGVLEAPTSPTKVIIAAQLVDKTGKALPLVEYMYKKYTLTSLPTYLANNTLNQLYKKTTTGGVSTYDKIAPSDIGFATAADLAANTDYGVKAPAGNPDYYTYVVLSDAAMANTNVTWQIGNENGAPVMSLAEVNAYIMNQTNHVLAWNTGYTYYYLDIRHLGAATSPGYEGIVRNHLYNTNITSIAGLGTPVYDPNQVIRPEKPEYNESIVMAKINILQWRMVSQDYELTW